MILELSYEEVTALNSAAERMRGGHGGGVAAPPEAIAALDERLPLRGDIEIDGPAEQARLLAALDAVLVHLKQRMDTLILELYVGADDPVNAYFDYANVLTTRHRLHELGVRMRTVDEVLDDLATGPGAPDAPDARDAPGAPGASDPDETDPADAVDPADAADAADPDAADEGRGGLSDPSQLSNP
jgi:hypothetical protein